MLRVITERQGDSFRLDLHGTLGGEWVGVLERHWRSVLDEVPSARVTLVLSNVEFIDPQGEQLLRRMAGRHVEFVVAGCLNRHVIDGLEDACERRGRKPASGCLVRVIAATALACPGRLERAGLSTRSEVRRRHPPAYPRKGYSVRRLFPTVLRGWPAVALLILRVSLAAAIACRRPTSHPVELGAALLLLGGAWTSAAAALIAILELWRTVLASGGWVSLQLSATAVALALVGPGIWSIDARVFGWRRIDIPASRRRQDSDQFS